MKLRMSAPRVGVRGMFLCAALLGAPLLTQAQHVGDLLAPDQQFSGASNTCLTALSQRDRLRLSRASNLAGPEMFSWP